MVSAVFLLFICFHSESDFFVFVTFEETAPPPAFSRCTKIGSSPQSSMITTSVLICANVCVTLHCHISLHHVRVFLVSGISIIAPV